MARRRRVARRHRGVAMPFRLEERYAIIETLAREVMPRVGTTG
jgi:hypothetical protein